MAQIDSSIYSQMRAPDILGGFLDGYSKGQQIRDANEKRKLQQDELAKQKGIDKEYENALVTDLDTGKVSIDESRLLGGVGKYGAKAVADAQEKIQAQQKVQRENEQYRNSEIARGLWAASQDPRQYPSVRADLINRGLISEKDAPPVHDPGFVRTALMRFSGSENYLKNQQAEANLTKTQAETRKINSEVVGNAGAPKMTESQSKSLGFGRRAVLADQMLNQILNDPNADVTSIKTQIKSGLPKWMNVAKSDAEQALNVAKSAFISSVLRKESGAAVTPEEFNTYDKIYFPQPGDSPQTLASKGTMRANFIDTEKLTAGNAWKDPIGVQPGSADTKVWEGKTYKRIGDTWVQQ